ncbi:MAG: hypothetical protein M1832_000915 [Thelocarpon impressellum]|nr:MAG: hypothetical protein M1832_000915 [Thelocarpon impressellum]
MTNPILGAEARAANGAGGASGASGTSGASGASGASGVKGEAAGNGTPVIPAPRKPTHPNLLRVDNRPEAFTSSAYSLVSMSGGTLFARIHEAQPTPVKAYTSVQVSPTEHIELNSDLVFCNHSCDPNLRFDMEKMEVWVCDDKTVKVGDAMTFFYPSTEWDMTQPFDCTCGAANCKGWIEGAGRMKLEDLEGYWLNRHIREMLAERRASDGRNGSGMGNGDVNGNGKYGQMDKTGQRH